jgi:hypothetical protein
MPRLTAAYGLLSLVLWGHALGGPAAQAPQSATPADAVTAFVDVNVVPMDRERVLQHATVLVQDGRILAIGGALSYPKSARVIDGHGSAFLSPGLADMHSHSDTREDLSVYLANGVTTVLNMGDASSEFMDHTRPKLNEGRIAGPHVYAAFRVDGSPRYGGFVIATPEEARAIVPIAMTNGYDFIKVYNDLSPECFEALIAEARSRHLAIVGHGVTRVGLERQLAEGQALVAHTEEFLYTTFGALGDSAPSADRIPEVIAFIKHSGAYVTADLNTYQTIARQWGRPEVRRTLQQQAQTRYLSPGEQLAWGEEDYDHRAGSIDAKAAFLRVFTKALSDAAVPLVAGTDAPSIPGLVPGFSLHDDLRSLEDAGLTRYQVLAVATRVPGEFIQKNVAGSEPFGTVTPGARADLILSAHNPLDDLSTLREPLGVMARGRWFPNSQLHELLDEVVRRYEGASLER